MDYVIIHLAKPRECTTPRLNPQVNYGFWVIRCVNVSSALVKKKCTILVNDFDNGGGYTCVEWGEYGKSLYLHLNFVVNLKLL